MFKVLHGPTLRKYVGDAAAHIDDIHHNRSIEALLFAMYYAAVTTMTSEDCTDYFQTDREVLLDRYRSATEYAFANANILLSSDLITLQALVIFLVSHMVLYLELVPPTGVKSGRVHVGFSKHGSTRASANNDAR